MASNNPLVDPASQFNPQDYEWHINPQTLSSPDLMASGPGGDWLSGTGMWADCEQLAKDIKSRNWAQVVFDSGAVALDTLGTIQDPIGTALSMLTGWMIDHLKPLKFILDELGGNPDTVTGVANTWTNISNALTEAAHNYAAAVQRDVAGWQGQAADAYRRQAATLVQGLGCAGALADGMSALVSIGAELVATVRSAVRDIIANLVGELISDAAQELCTAGAATPLVVEEATGAIDRETSVVTKLVESLVKVLKNAVFIASKVNTLLSEIAKIVPLVQRISKDASTAAS